MKNFTFALFFIATFLVSCSSDDDNASAVQSDDITGVWELKKSIFHNGVNVIYPNVLVTYTFENNTLTVKNNAAETTDLTPKPSGRLGTNVYTYTVTEIENKKYLTVQNDVSGETELGNFFISNNGELIVNQIEQISGVSYDYVMYFEQ
ncbi:hypothetical protein U8527_08045 [Kordia algicida OT-1]|uniref:Lipocalin-like domain-containing protein n=1 Tax=Kordia algicida OT-1 TaxID=391587 RepID=A9E939_9FLAO|nr:hypothetical protein [Kordia algicida]EDP94855.1 hypothetical protein KAOT1_01475 [Kordia algicida OT-1]